MNVILSPGLALWLTLLLTLLFLLPMTLAQNQQYQLKLLAVQEAENGTLSGSDADLFLEIQEGSGRVFLETFPLTKLDTQISTRFAKEVACHHFQLDCSRYDFIYTIKAKSPIIGGPSAGAAIAALTSIAVLDLPYHQDIAVTGTINSGGIIGPVGGIRQKLEAAAQAKLKKVLIPQGTGTLDEAPEAEGEIPLDNTTTSEDNTTNITSPERNNTTTEEIDNQFNLLTYGKENLSIEVQEVPDLDEVIFQLTGKQLNNRNVTITESPVYKNLMEGLQQVLCERSLSAQEELLKEFSLNNETFSFVTQKMGQAKNATQLEDFYSAASFCFTANIRLKKELYQQKKLTREAYDQLFSLLAKKVATVEEKIKQEEIQTIGDLQTLMIVQERIQEVHQQIEKFPSAAEEELPALLAYAEERFFSALSWMQFFSMEGKQFLFDAVSLEKSCTNKIAESEERHQYVSLFLGERFLVNIQQKINEAKKAQEQKEFPLCLITAAQAKADADAILSTLGVREEALPELLAQKQKVVKRIIAENSAEDIFPILGYSYYQYANSLVDEDKYTALLYLEYALEMSDLSMYFPEEKKYRTVQKGIDELLQNEQILLFVAGVLVGVTLTLVLVKREKRKKVGRRREERNEEENE